MTNQQLVPSIKVSKMKTNVRRVGYVCLILLADPTWTFTLLGTGLIALAVLFHGWAAGYLAREGNKNRDDVQLTLGGPYRHNRNPYYVSHFLLDFGFFVLSGHPVFYLLYFPFIYSVYRYFVLNKEEPFLEERFGEAFETYKNTVPRWGVRLSPARIDGTASESFSWRDYWFNREFSRSLNHVVLMGVFWLIQFGYLPVAEISLSTRLLLLSLYCTWILIHYMLPRSGQDTYYAWGFMGFLLTVPMGFGLFNDTELWSGYQIGPSWLFPALGIGLLVLGSGIFLSRISESLRTFYRDKLDRPLEIILILGLGVGFLLGYPGVFWVTIVACLCLWFLRTAGLFRFRPLVEQSD